MPLFEATFAQTNQPKHNIQKLVDKRKTIKKEFKAFPGEHKLTLFIKKLYKRRVNPWNK